MQILEGSTLSEIERERDTRGEGLQRKKDLESKAVNQERRALKEIESEEQSCWE